MILFAFEEYAAIARAARFWEEHVPHGRFKTARFENRELHIAVDTPVEGEHCVVMGSIAPPDEQLLTTSLLIHTLKKEGATKVTAFLPYLAYARHDDDKTGQSMALAWAGSLLKASGCDQIITVDVHSEKAKQLLDMPLISLSPAGIFAEAITQHELSHATVVAPDEGAIKRCETVLAAAGMTHHKVPYFTKHRIETGIIHAGPIGNVGSQVLLVDDILDTAGTLLSACERLSKARLDKIDVMVTHGLFTGTRWTDLFRLGVRRIFCTDSVPAPRGVAGYPVVRLSIIPLIAKEMLAIDNAVAVIPR